MLLHYPRSCLGIRSIDALLVLGCVWCCICLVMVLLVCACLFDGVFARRGYCFVFVVRVGVVVMVVMIVFVGGIGVVLVVRCVMVIFGVVALVRVIIIVLLK